MIDIVSKNGRFAQFLPYKWFDTESTAQFVDRYGRMAEN